MSAMTGTTFRIGRDQIDWFAQRAQARFGARMAPYLRAHYGDLVAELPSLEDWLRDRVAEALQGGVTEEPEVAQYVLVQLVLLPHDHAHDEWVESVMADRSLLAVGKVRRLVAEARGLGVARIEDVDFTHTLEGL